MRKRTALLALLAAACAGREPFAGDGRVAPRVVPVSSIASARGGLGTAHEQSGKPRAGAMTPDRGEGLWQVDLGRGTGRVIVESTRLDDKEKFPVLLVGLELDY